MQEVFTQPFKRLKRLMHANQVIKEKAMNKVAVRIHAGVKHIWYYCPGCKHLHNVPAERWNWNGSETSPTLSPSVRHYSSAIEGLPEITHCHYHIKEGRIEFCSDCPHEFSGKVVELQDPTSAWPVPDSN